MRSRAQNETIMHTLTTIPDELLLEILKHDVPDTITTYQEFYTYKYSRKLSVKIFKAAIESFWTHSSIKTTIDPGRSHRQVSNGVCLHWVPVRVMTTGIDEPELLKRVINAEIIIRVPEDTISIPDHANIPQGRQITTQDYVEALHHRLSKMPRVAKVIITIECETGGPKNEMLRLVEEILIRTEEHLGRTLKKRALNAHMPVPERRTICLAWG